MELLKSSYSILYPNQKLKINTDFDQLTITYDSIAENINIKLLVKNNQFIPISDVMSQHMYRLLKLHHLDIINADSVFDITNFINDKSSNILSFCTICGIEINFQSIISSCEKCKCKNKIYELVTDNSVTNCYKNDQGVFKFLILTAYACLLNRHKIQIANPFPKFFKSFEDLESKIHFNLKNMKELLQTLNNVTNDFELFDKIGSYDYSFLKFIIKSNITNMKSDMLFKKDSNIFVEKNIDDIINPSEILTFQISCDELTNKRFETPQIDYLFHGSTLSNWYSILRNGLKVFSGTSMMIHGAAYGNGIYLSDSAGISFGYGRDIYCQTKLIAIGVVQVLNKDTYRKSPGIFVVPNENDILLKYVILLNEQKDLEFITNYFTKQRTNEIMKSNGQIVFVKTKRVNHDIDKLTKIGKKHNFVVESNNTIVIVKWNDLTIGIKYPSDYPALPPFIWVIEQNAKLDENIILEKGGIVIKHLLPSNWKAETKIYKIIKKISKIITTTKIPTKTFDENESFQQYCDICKQIK